MSLSGTSVIPNRLLRNKVVIFAVTTIYQRESQVSMLGNIGDSVKRKLGCSQIMVQWHLKFYLVYISKSCSPYTEHSHLSAHILCIFLNHLITLVFLVISPASTLLSLLSTSLPVCCCPLSVMSSLHVWPLLSLPPVQSSSLAPLSPPSLISALLCQ